MVCKKCGHKTVTEHGVKKCLSCGTEVVSVQERSRFIQANLSDILADIRDLGFKKTQEKWRISSATLWKISRHARKSPAAIELTAAPEPSKNGMPPLPAFDNSWESSVQLKWLEIWAECDKR